MITCFSTIIQRKKKTDAQDTKWYAQDYFSYLVTKCSEVWSVLEWGAIAFSELKSY